MCRLAFLQNVCSTLNYAKGTSCRERSRQTLNYGSAVSSSSKDKKTAIHFFLFIDETSLNITSFTSVCQLTGGTLFWSQPYTIKTLTNMNELDCMLVLL